MENKEWLEKVEKFDEGIQIDTNSNLFYQYRQAKALEIIAEELIKLNDNRRQK